VARACDDGRACTSDSCSEPARSCSSDTSACECATAGDCDDQNPCTDDRCANLACTHDANTAQCSDGDECTTGDHCAAGECAGAPRVCNAHAGNPCVTDACDSDVGCVTRNTTAACDDANACTVGDACSDGSCKAGTPRVCNAHAGNPCIADSCDMSSGCTSHDTTAACDDGRACTSGDVCSAGVCTGTPGTGCGAGPTRLPTNQRTCPTFVEGTMQFLDNDVEIVALGSAALHGPIVFYWHGTGSSPLEARVGLGTTVISQIKAAGGIVVGMIGDQGSGQNTSGNGVWHDSDMVVADEVLACAILRGIDTRHIHALGMSAGGLQTTSFSYMRSNYLASVVVYSGGLTFGNPAYQDANNKFAAMIVHGGDSDVVSGFSFQDASVRYRDDLRTDGHFAFLCNHDGGHTIPSGIGTHAWRFFQDHPYGTQPSPYASALPSTFPTYCTLQ
jgi:hypothetical protein